MFRKIRLWLCKHLGWHSPGPSYKDDKDPFRFLNFAKCKICGYEGQLDSQGNLF